METRRRPASPLAQLILTLLALSAGVATAAPPVVPRPAPGIPPRAPSQLVDADDAAQLSALERLRQSSSVPLTARFEAGQPLFLHGRVPVSGATAGDQVLDFHARFTNSLWRLGPNSELLLQRSDPVTGLASFRQLYRGLPVIGGELNVFLGQPASRTEPPFVYAARGSLLPGDGLDTIPSFEAAGVLALLNRRGELPLAPPRLAVSFLPERLRTGGFGDPVAKLVWTVAIQRDGRGFLLHVDAQSGAILREASTDMDSAAAFDEYEAEWFDANEDFSPYCQGDADEVVEAGDDDGLFSAYQNRDDYVVGWTNSRRGYSFFYDFYGRLSYDGSDGPVLGYHESPETTNAFWSSACEEINWARNYGSSDTPVHELSHGVTQFTSNLAYQDESGALNESFSDVMSAIADTDGDGRWLQGEDSLGGGGAIRSLENPSRDHYSDLIIDDDDDGGVHRNSGIGNKAAFLLSQGGIHPQSGYPVDGIGVTMTGRILYAAYTSLDEYADYDDLRNTAVSIATYWFALGIHGFTLDDVCSVKNAYAAVGVDGRGPLDDAGGGGDVDCDGVEDFETDDNDGDGVTDFYDNCRNVANPSQTDTDGDEDEPIGAQGDACDANDDNDEHADVDDNCPTVPNDSQADLDGDGIGNACDDSDGDGHNDFDDNCPDDYNPSQADSNGDGFYGDACDPDEDGDGVPASDGDNCPNVANADQADTDGDFYGDACDSCPNDADSTPAFTPWGAPFQPDSDEDGVPDECDTSFTIDGRPTAEGLLVSQDERPAALEIGALSRVRVPLVVCPPPCAETERAPFFTVDLSALPDSVTALVTDDVGHAVARSKTLGDGSRRLGFAPRGDRQYFLTFQAGADPPEPGAPLLFTFQQASPPPPPADVGVAIAADPDPVAVGEQVTFTATVTNTTMSEATGVSLAIDAGPNVSFPGGTHVDVGTLAAGHSETFTFVGDIGTGAAAGPLTATATVTTVSTDPDPSNDVASATVEVVMPKADLSVTVLDAPDPVKAGNVLLYTVRVENVGGAVAQKPFLSSSLSGGVSVVAVVSERGSCAQSGRLVVCNLGPTLAPGRTVHVKIAVRVASNLRPGSSLSHVARVHSPSDSSSENNVAIARTAVIR